MTIEQPYIEPIAGKQLTREGFLAYFNQMVTGEGVVETTPDWLADIAMLIVHEARKPEPTADSEPVNCPDPQPPLRTYRAAGATWPIPADNTNTFTDKPDSPELSLLVVDFGECCAVYHEHGASWCLTVANQEYLFDDYCDMFAVKAPFAAVREAISQAPVPRIERMKGQDRYLLFQEKAQRSGYPNPSAIYQAEYAALSQLAGHELPVWSGGTWKQLWNPSDLDLPFQAWRYTW